MSGIDLLISAFAKQQISALPNHVLLECGDFAMAMCVLVFVTDSKMPSSLEALWETVILELQYDVCLVFVPSLESCRFRLHNTDTAQVRSDD